MFAVNTTVEEAIGEFPLIQEWIDTISEKIIKTDLSDSKIEICYTYGFFLPKTEDKEKLYTDIYEKSSQMKFDERLDFELSKLRVSINLKIDTFYMTCRLPNGTPPASIKSIVTEITKVKMMAEGKYHENQEVIDSIPEVDQNIIKIDMQNIASQKDEIEEQYDLDSLLDKISIDGMDSLNEKEKEFLNNRSKEI